MDIAISQKKIANKYALQFQKFSYQSKMLQIVVNEKPQNWQCARAAEDLFRSSVRLILCAEWANALNSPSRELAEQLCRHPSQ